MNVITNARGEVLVYKSADSGPKFHDDPKFARPYRTLKGARCAATVWSKRFGMPLTAAAVAVKPAAK